MKERTALFSTLCQVECLQEVRKDAKKKEERNRFYQKEYILRVLLHALSFKHCPFHLIQIKYEDNLISCAQPSHRKLEYSTHIKLTCEGYTTFLRAF